MTISVIIPTYRRIEGLSHCLEALRKQTIPAGEILAVMRDTDEETGKFLEEATKVYPALRICKVVDSGQVAALNAGLLMAGGDIIAFTDDDTIPHADWLERIESHYKRNPAVGGVGGRDHMYRDGRFIDGKKKTVGKFLWFGAIAGNHHLGFGDAREVDHFKGANMSFRRKALEGLCFDKRLRGQGAQYRNDMALCLAVKRKGWKLIYDPNMIVEHFYAARHEKDQRDGLNSDAVKDAAYNQMLIFLEYLPVGKGIVCILYTFFVGSSFIPGIIQWLRLLITGRKNAWLKYSAAGQGWLEALKTHSLKK